MPRGGYLLSPVYSEQQEAQRNIAELLEQTNSAAVFSQGRLKIVSYGDSGLYGNGATYIPNLTPLYDLSDDDFIVSGAEDPVRVERKGSNIGNGMRQPPSGGCVLKPNYIYTVFSNYI